MALCHTPPTTTFPFSLLSSMNCQLQPHRHILKQKKKKQPSFHMPWIAYTQRCNAAHNAVDFLTCPNVILWVLCTVKSSTAALGSSSWNFLSFTASLSQPNKNGKKPQNRLCSHQIATHFTTFRRFFDWLVRQHCPPPSSDTDLGNIFWKNGVPSLQ